MKMLLTLPIGLLLKAYMAFAKVLIKIEERKAKKANR